MARLARVVVPGIPHHITQRGNRRQDVFFGEEDYEIYLSLMREWCKKAGVEIWAYCLMTNHIHLIAVPKSEEALARGIGEAHRRYTRAINQREGWTGYLWQGRFASYAMDEAHLFEAVRYVERNPVAAGIVRQAWDYRWSSARAHLAAANDSLVKVKPMLKRVEDWAHYLSGTDDEDSIKGIEAHLRTGRPLGDATFIERLERKLDRPLKPAKRGRKPGAETQQNTIN